MAIFMDDILQPPIENAFWINALTLLFGVTLPLPLVGMLSDYCGRVKTMVVGCIGLGAFGPIAVFVISKGQAVSAFFAQLILGLLLCLFGGPISAWLVEKFPPKVRLTSASLGYDLAHCTASAFSPLVATVLAQKVSLSAPGILYTFFAFLALIGMFTSSKIHQDGGVEDVNPDDIVIEAPVRKDGDGDWLPTEGEEEPTEKEII